MDRLRRDRLTRVTYAHFAVFGFAVYAFSPCVPLLRDELELSRGVAALHATLLAVGNVVAALGGPRVVRRLGRRATLSGGLVVICAGIVVITSAGTLPFTLLGAFVVGCGMPLCANAGSAILYEHHGSAAGGALAECNALAAGLGVVAPLAVGGADAAGLGWRIGLLAVLPLTALVLLGSRGSLAGSRADSAVGPVQMAQRDLPRAYWLMWTAALCAVAVEFCLTTWGSELVRERTGLRAGPATAAVTLLVAGMAIGRWYGTRLALRRSAQSLLFGALALTAIGFSGLWLTHAPAVACGALFVAGLGIALQFPLMLARAIAAAGGRTDEAVARVSIGSGIAIGGAPFALGAAADAIGTHAASLLVPALLLVAGTVLWAGRYERSPIPT